MTLWIYDSNADTAEIEKGVAAALEYFTENNIDPAAAGAALQADADGEPHEADLITAWFAAETAAFNAAFEGWAEWPEGAHMEMESDA